MSTYEIAGTTYETHDVQGKDYGGMLTTEVEKSEVPGFKLKTKKFALQHLLDKAQWVIPTKDLLPVLKNFLVEVSPGKVRVTATDLELSIVASNEMVDVEKSGRAVFPARRLLDIVREAGDGDIEIEVKDGEARIEVNRTQWTLKLMSGADYPELPDVSKLKFHQIDRAKFIAAIRAVRYAAATETVRPSLMLIDVTNGEMRASDGVRFQQIKVGKDIPIDIQIPINAVDDLIKILHTSESPTIEIGEDENTLIFRVSGDVFLAQKLNATFPDVNDMLLKPALANDQELHADRQDLVSAIKRVRITADPETSAIVLHLDKDRMLVTSKDKYSSTCEEEVDVSWSGPKRKVAFNHTHLLDMLDMTDVKTCKFFLGPDTKTRPSPILLRDDETGLLGVLNQVRVDWIS